MPRRCGCRASSSHSDPSGLAAAACALGSGGAVLIAAWPLARVCVSEVSVLLGAQALLIVAWCCTLRPLMGPTYLYLLACVLLLVRETSLALSGRVPCGLPTFGDSCIETRCAEYHRLPIIGIRTGCARYECVRYERKEVSHVFTSSESFNEWTGVALFAVWLTLVTSARQLRQWRARCRLAVRDVDARVAQYVAVILAVPVTYGVCALHALRTLSVNPEDTWQAEGMLSAAELYSAVALLAFQRLLEVHVKDLEAGAIPEDLEGDTLKGVQAGAQQRFQVRSGFQRLIAAGVKQYVVLVFGCNALEMVAKTWNWAYPDYCRAALAEVAGVWFPHHEISIAPNASMVHSSVHTRESTIACEDLWNTVSLLMVVANFFTCSIALYAVLQYERAYTDLLEPIRPFWKFLGVKGLLSVNFLQRIVLMTLGFLATGSPALSGSFRTFLNFFLICLESTALASMNVCAYRVAAGTGSKGEVCGLTEDLHDDLAVGAPMPEPSKDADLEVCVVGKPFD